MPDFPLSADPAVSEPAVLLAPADCPPVPGMPASGIPFVPGPPEVLPVFGAFASGIVVPLDSAEPVVPLLAPPIVVPLDMPAGPEPVELEAPGDVPAETAKPVMVNVEINIAVISFFIACLFKMSD